MSEEQAPQEQDAQEKLAEQPAKRKGVEKTVLRPYPKVVFFYLTWICALVCGIVMSFYSEAGKSMDQLPSWPTYAFLLVFSFNLLVVAFEFSRMLSVSVLFLLLAFVFLGLWAGFLEGIFGFLKGIHPHADHQFFFFIFVVFTVIFALVWIQTRFNYWVVRKNELLHKHGFMGDVKRYHAQDVKIDKEIGDVLELLLLRSGTMVLYPEGEHRAIVLENIIGINKKEIEVKEILESYAIRIDKD